MFGSPHTSSSLPHYKLVSNIYLPSLALTSSSVPPLSLLSSHAPPSHFHIYMNTPPPPCTSAHTSYLYTSPPPTHMHTHPPTSTHMHAPPLPSLLPHAYTFTHLPPPPPPQVPWVEELYVYGNRVSYLPHELSNLKKLRTLALNENLLSGLPGGWTIGLQSGLVIGRKMNSVSPKLSGRDGDAQNMNGRS